MWQLASVQVEVLEIQSPYESSRLKEEDQFPEEEERHPDLHLLLQQLLDRVNDHLEGLDKRSIRVEEQILNLLIEYEYPQL